jgi:cysteine-rich repeat protein
MTKLGFSPRRWLARHVGTPGGLGGLGVYAAAFGLAMATGCATQIHGGVGGAGTGGEASSSSGTGGAASTSSVATTSSSVGTGGSGTGGMTTTSTTVSSTTSTTSTTVSSSSGTGGTGGAGGAYMPPQGTAEYPAEVEQNNLKSSANPLAMGAKGFTAAIYPQGDVDVFTFTITQGGTSATISTSDGMGGCPAGAKTYMRVFDANNGVLATDSGMSGCVLLTPAANPSLAGLAAGTYYVHIESANINPILKYVLDIKLTAPGCGDSVVQVASGEQCDDGNTTPGDGCSATCHLENGNYLNETEPNDTQATGNLLDGYAGAVGQISPLADGDFYTFNVTTAGSSVTADISDGNGGCPNSFDSKIYLFSPTMTQLVADDDGGVSPCSKIDPNKYPAATNLPVGLYAIRVERFGNSATTPFYVLKVKVSAPGCGDGILQTGEQCDDNNTTAGDGCSPTCQFEGNYTSETEVNDTQALANHLPAGSDGFAASINPAGDLDYFSFDVTTAGSSVILATTDGVNGCPSGFDSKIFLYDPAHTEIANNDDGPVPPCSRISPATHAAAANLAVGTYTVKVQHLGGLVQPSYVLTIKVSTPGCGDGLIQSGEQCDDGNTTSGDGCSATCQAESPYEIEPNNSTATANALWSGTSLWKGSINPLLDHDYFTFNLTAIGTPTLTTHTVNDPTACTFDTVIHLLDHTGTQIVQDDDGGVNSCSMISSALYPQVHNLPVGTYYVWVQAYNDVKTIPAYQLDLSIQ